MLLDWFVHHKRFGRFKNLFGRRVLEARPLTTFPRVIHMYWAQGLNDAPEVVLLSIDSWKRHNPGWKLILWDERTANAVVDRSTLPEGVKTTPYSDMLRTALLMRQGGVWADATVLCMRPLDHWLPVIMAQCDFFAFSGPGTDREIGSWFLASRPNSYVVTALWRAVTAYWNRRKTPTRVYHWYHYTFEYLIRTSARFRRAWEKCPRMSAVPMISLQERLAAGSLPSADELALERAAPMHKLTYKRDLRLDLLAEVQETA